MWEKLKAFGVLVFSAYMLWRVGNNVWDVVHAREDLVHAREDLARARATLLAGPEEQHERQPPAPTPLEQVMAADNFYNAYQEAKPYLSDTVGEPSPGAAMLALWFGERGHWNDVHPTFPGPKVKQVKKDIASARGRFTCVKGTIVQLARDPTASRLFVGTLATSEFDFVHYFAGGSTGDLVDGEERAPVRRRNGSLLLLELVRRSDAVRSDGRHVRLA